MQKLTHGHTENNRFDCTVQRYCKLTERLNTNVILRVCLKMHELSHFYSILASFTLEFVVAKDDKLKLTK